MKNFVCLFMCLFMRLFMRLLMCLLMAVTFGLVTGCASYSGRSSVVVMQHPETMEFVNCKVGGWGTAGAYAENEKCVEDLKKKGYIVWGER